MTQVPTTFGVNAVGACAPSMDHERSHLFCRSTYFKQVHDKGQVTAVIISTYTLNLTNLQNEFGSLFGPEATIPTLVFHGEKTDLTTSAVQGAPTRKRVSKMMPAWMMRLHQLEDSLEISEQVFFYKILSKVSAASRGSEAGDRTTYGVHHSKYMLIFTSSGLHVIISTANFTKPTSVDVSWCQCFPLHQTAGHLPTTLAMESDFGITLEHFINSQVSCIVYLKNQLDSSLLQNGGIGTWLGHIYESPLLSCELTTLFDFSSAEADLVAVVPGFHADPLPSLLCCSCDSVQRPLIYCPIRKTHTKDTLFSIDASTSQHAGPSGLLFFGHTFCIIGEFFKCVTGAVHRRADLCCMVTQQAGKLSVLAIGIGCLVLVDNTVERTVALRAIIRNGRFDVLDFNYILDCIDSEKQLSLSSYYVSYSTDTRSRLVLSRQVDFFGLSYYDDIDERGLRNIFASMGEDLLFMVASNRRIISKRKRRTRELLRMRQELDCIETDLQTFQTNDAATWQCLMQSHLHEDDAELLTAALQQLPWNKKTSAKSTASSNVSEEVSKPAEEVAIAAIHLKYGMFRVKEVLRRNTSMLPRSLDKNDELIVQPTSVGSKLSKQFMTSFVEHYTPTDCMSGLAGKEDQRWRLIWPVVNFEEAHLASVASTHTRALLFLNSTSFATLDMSTRNRFATYVPNRAAHIDPITSVSGPHTKLYMRLMERCLEQTDTCLCVDLAWCLLTSACLSRGAQGERFLEKKCKICNGTIVGFVKFTNFEIGVLLHSRKGRQYRALCSACPQHSFRSEESVAKDISMQDVAINVLPIPFDLLNNELYHDTKGDLCFQPFTH